MNPNALELKRISDAEVFAIPGAEQVKALQDVLGKYPEFVPSSLLSYAVGRKTMKDSAGISRLASTYVDERAFGAGMAALRLIDAFILQVDPSVCGLPAFAPGFSSLQKCLY